MEALLLPVTRSEQTSIQLTRLITTMPTLQSPGSPESGASETLDPSGGKAYGDEASVSSATTLYTGRRYKVIDGAYEGEFGYLRATGGDDRGILEDEETSEMYVLDFKDLVEAPPPGQTREERNRAQYPERQKFVQVPGFKQTDRTYTELREHWHGPLAKQYRFPTHDPEKTLLWNTRNDTSRFGHYAEDSCSVASEDFLNDYFVYDGTPRVLWSHSTKDLFHDVPLDFHYSLCGLVERARTIPVRFAVLCDMLLSQYAQDNRFVAGVHVATWGNVGGSGHCEFPLDFYYLVSSLAASAEERDIEVSTLCEMVISESQLVKRHIIEEHTWTNREPKETIDIDHFMVVVKEATKKAAKDSANK